MKGVEIVSEEWIIWKAAYEYENGKLKSERFYSLNMEMLAIQGEEVEFTKAYYYARYDNADFPNFQTEVWYYDTQNEGGIPDDYDYKANKDTLIHDWSGDIKYEYTPDADDESRVGEYIIYINPDGWIEDEKIGLTYDESGNLLSVDIYKPFYSRQGLEWILDLRLDIVVPENLNFGFGELFFDPWHDLIIPFEGNDEEDM